jgi:hypothetical protein
MMMAEPLVEDQKKAKDISGGWKRSWSQNYKRCYFLAVPPVIYFMYETMHYFFQYIFSKLARFGML